MESQFYIFNNLKLFAGPIIFDTGQTEDEIISARIKADMLELSKSCCKTCGVYLELNEKNEKMLCCVCIEKPLKVKSCC